MVPAGATFAVGLTQAGGAGGPDGPLGADPELRLAENGTLRVRLARGVGLLAADKGGTFDPYVVLQLGKTSTRAR